MAFFYYVFLILFSFGSAIALTPPSILDTDLCKGYKSNLIEKDFQQMFQRAEFPRPGESLDRFLIKVQKWDQWSTKANGSCRQEGSDPKMPNEAVSALAEVYGHATQAIKRDLQVQRNKVELNEVCAGLMADSAIPDKCKQFVEMDVPALKHRLRLMRQLLFLAQKNPTATRLSHEKSYLTDLVSKMLPSTWKGQAELSPLTDVEKKGLPAVTKQIKSQEQALQQY